MKKKLKKNYFLNTHSNYEQDKKNEPAINPRTCWP